jgi:AraC-like DNA-binding protein
MKPELEHIVVEEKLHSFRYFKLSETVFLPYWHYHPEIELTLITKGKGTRFIGDSIASFSDFDLVLVGKNLPHHWVSSSKTNNQEAYVFQFKASLFKGFAECQIFDDLFEMAKRGIHFLKPKKQVLEHIISFENLSSTAKLAKLIEVLEELYLDKNFHLLSSEHYANRAQNHGSQKKITQTTNYILEHLNERLTVDRMAQLTNMAPQSFCRWFKKYSGHSFVSFLNQSRIEKVCFMLTTTDKSIQDIAYSSGFESISHFNRTFRKIKGLNPSDYRKSNLKLD